MKLRGLFYFRAVFILSYLHVVYAVRNSVFNQIRCRSITFSLSFVGNCLHFQISTKQKQNCSKRNDFTNITSYILAKSYICMCVYKYSYVYIHRSLKFCLYISKFLGILAGGLIILSSPRWNKVICKSTYLSNTYYK